MKKKQNLDRRDTYTPGKSILIKGGEKKMNISTKKVKIVGYGRELMFIRQFLPTLLRKVFLEGLK
ncbi:MAG: hypothetical protein AMDU4_FER2C00014G0014 [Ferroplasma sp. Type II]|uniref:hypothetical protein n=1 Tax=Ferroplasma sp. Type II TaxID=261388 RepID=UPI000389544E|nr:hypothetical protein [Ferroplasma sp. Type II]EQB74375.1 MAG: hypothetical protein AMDU4_FER2C00014G0014 [Ferroplasma sp. Type II]